MSKTILTSNFPNGMSQEIAAMFRSILTERDRFAFIASDFEHGQDKTDYYMQIFLDLLSKQGIRFENAYVVDGRMSPEQAQKAVAAADVVWLSGGDTAVEFADLKRYGLIPVIKAHKGVVIGMSAGSINLAKTAIRTLSCGHDKQAVYEGIGRSKLTVEPHFTVEKDNAELLQLSEMYEIYGLCDGSIIACVEEDITLIGEVYRIYKGQIARIG